MEQILQLLKSDNRDDEILGWRLAVETLELNKVKDLIREMSVYRQYTHRPALNRSQVLIFDNIRIVLGKKFVTNYLEEDDGVKRLILDFREK